MWSVNEGDPDAPTGFERARNGFLALQGWVRRGTRRGPLVNLLDINTSPTPVPSNSQRLYRTLFRVYDHH